MVAYVKPGIVIDAEHYNVMQTRVANVLGTGTGLYGYGQTLTSSQVSAGTVITATHMQNLKADIDKCRLHQINSASYIDVDNTTVYTLASTVVSDLITAGAVDANDNSIVDTTDKSYNDFENAISQIETDHLEADDNQMTVDTTALVKTRGPNNNWNGERFHEFTVTFTDANQRRYFFNTGGQIQFFSRISDYGTDSKAGNWNSMLTNAGVISMNWGTTTKPPTSTGTAYAVGNDDLTSSYQTLYYKPGSDVYAANKYYIEGKVVIENAETASQSRKLRFKVRFLDDAGPNPNFDEDVIGKLESFVYERISQGGTSGVEITSPSYATDSTTTM